MKYSVVRPIFLILVMIMAVAVYLDWAAWWMFVPLGISYSILLIYGAITVHSGFFTEAICSSDKPNKLALTFDDGPDPEHTPKMLDFLKKHSLVGTFFLIGERVEANPDLVKRIVDEGHTVANHTYSHPITWGFSFPKQLNYQIEKTRSIIEDITGKSPLYFRPPFGVVNPTVAKVIDKMDLNLIGWDIRSRDGGPIKADQIYRFVKPRIGKGSIALFHDTNPETPAALERVIEDCKQQGVEIVSLQELIEKPAYA